MLFGHGGRARHRTLVLRMFSLGSLLFQRVVLSCNLGELSLLLVELLLKGCLLPLKVEAIIFLHVVLLLKNEQILAFVIREVQIDPDGQLASSLLVAHAWWHDANSPSLLELGLGEVEGGLLGLQTLALLLV
jgi:hypothetical protein